MVANKKNDVVIGMLYMIAEFAQNHGLIETLLLEIPPDIKEPPSTSSRESIMKPPQLIYALINTLHLSVDGLRHCWMDSAQIYCLQVTPSICLYAQWILSLEADLWKRRLEE